MLIHDSLETFDPGERVEAQDLAGGQGIGQAGAAVLRPDGAIAGGQNIEPGKKTG